MDDLGRFSDEELEEQFTEIVDKVLGNYAISDFDGGKYDLLPELFIYFLSNQTSPGLFKSLEGKIKEVEKLLLELRQNITKNHRRSVFEAKNT